MSILESGCQDFELASRLEWLETNGLGSFAMGTCAGVNTRRYHGLLVASLRPPADRRLLLARLEDRVETGTGIYDLSTCQYPGTIAPAGFKLLTGFDCDPFPHWRFRVPAIGEESSVAVQKELFLVSGQNSVIVRYRASDDVKLRVRPMLAFRDYHSLGQANGQFCRDVSLLSDGIAMSPYEEMPRLRMIAPGSSFEANAIWYYNVEYLRELDRGLDFREDLYSPGVLTLELKAGEWSSFLATTGNEDWSAFRLNATRESEALRRVRYNGLDRAAEQFLVEDSFLRPTIIAGYPWFTDWGRDTMIALPGLLICRGQLLKAREILENYLSYLKQGLIPNRFPDGGGSPEYNTVDATLWMFLAANAYLKASGDGIFLSKILYPAVKQIIEWHWRGTFFGIRADPSDGLLVSGEPGVQLTWMDAKVGDYVVTPRHGKPVEINALWINALYLTAGWARDLGDSDFATECMVAADRGRSSFAEKFWSPQLGCLYDVIGPGGPDASVRPNQVIACSLPFALLTVEQTRSVLAVAERELLTPFGLRTLAPTDQQYRGRYEGSPYMRDASYHQGTVWPWLLGPYVKAYLKVYGRTPECLEYCRKLIERLTDGESEQCFGSIGEVFDGDAPHRPGGAPAQAWSVGQLIEASAAIEGLP